MNFDYKFRIDNNMRDFGSYYSHSEFQNQMGGTLLINVELALKHGILGKVIFHELVHVLLDDCGRGMRMDEEQVAYFVGNHYAWLLGEYWLIMSEIRDAGYDVYTPFATVLKTY